MQNSDLADKYDIAVEILGMLELLLVFVFTTINYFYTKYTTGPTKIPTYIFLAQKHLSFCPQIVTYGHQSIH